MIHGRRADALLEARGAIVQSGGSASLRQADLADDHGADSAYRELPAQHAEIDIIVNNAGARDRRPLAKLDRAALRRILEVNLGASVRARSP